MKEPKVIDLRKQAYDIVISDHLLCISTEEATMIIDDEVLATIQQAYEI